MTRLTLITAAMLAPLPSMAQEVGNEGGGPMETRGATYLQEVEDIKVEDRDGDVIGEVEQILIDEEGRPAGYLLEIGGFLDIGDYDVAVPLEALEWTGSHYVSKMNAEQLEQLSEFDES